MLTRTMYGVTAGSKAWTEVERDQLADLYLATPRPPFDVMSEKIGRSPQALQTEANRMGLTSPGAKPRTCLTCQRTFYSWGIGNRICRRCDRTLLTECA